MIPFSEGIYFNYIPLIKSRTARNHDIKVMFGNFRNRGIRRKMATGIL